MASLGVMRGRSMKLSARCHCISKLLCLFIYTGWVASVGKVQGTKIASKVGDDRITNDIVDEKVNKIVNERLHALTISLGVIQGRLDVLENDLRQKKEHNYEMTSQLKLIADRLSAMEDTRASDVSKNDEILRMRADIKKIQDAERLDDVEDIKDHITLKRMNDDIVTIRQQEEKEDREDAQRRDLWQGITAGLGFLVLSVYLFRLTFGIDNYPDTETKIKVKDIDINTAVELYNKRMRGLTRQASNVRLDATDEKDEDADISSDDNQIQSKSSGWRDAPKQESKISYDSIVNGEFSSDFDANTNIRRKIQKASTVPPRTMSTKQSDTNLSTASGRPILPGEKLVKVRHRTSLVSMRSVKSASRSLGDNKSIASKSIASNSRIIRKPSIKI